MSGPQTVLREQVATALATIPEVVAGDWTVLADPVDAVEPPVYLIVEGPDPAGVRRGFCSYDVQLEVIAVAARLEPEANYPLAETMVTAAIVALETARLAPYQFLAVAPFEVAQITFLAARLQLRHPVTFGGT